MVSSKKTATLEKKEMRFHYYFLWKIAFSLHFLRRMEARRNEAMNVYLR